jgi:hypothetical protein
MRKRRATTAGVVRDTTRVVEGAVLGVMDETPSKKYKAVLPLMSTASRKDEAGGLRSRAGNR